MTDINELINKYLDLVYFLTDSNKFINKYIDLVYCITDSNEFINNKIKIDRKNQNPAVFCKFPVQQKKFSGDKFDNDRRKVD